MSEVDLGLQHLSRDDVEIIGECLFAAVEGPFFPEWEFSTLFGLQRAEVASVLGLWPNVTGTEKTVMLAVNNAIGNLLGYPHGEDLSRFVSATPERMLEILKRWRMR